MKLLSKKEKTIFKSIKPTRKRAVSKFSIEKKDKWKINRVPCEAFCQAQGLVKEKSFHDFRLGKRFFKELPEEMVDDDLIKLIIGVTKKISINEPRIKKMSLVVHHTEVFSYPDQLASNAPEGIHQDGMDYIVSALVIQRKNVLGGRSIIYSDDMRTRILEVELAAGQGILQPDKNSILWHEVTSIESLDRENLGTRSTLGFDFDVLELS